MKLQYMYIVSFKMHLTFQSKIAILANSGTFTCSVHYPYHMAIIYGSESFLVTLGSVLFCLLQWNAGIVSLPAPLDHQVFAAACHDLGL